MLNAYTYGVEIEFFTNIDVDYWNDDIADAREARIEEIESDTPHGWNVERDCSLSDDPSANVGLEIQSPILASTIGFEQIADACNAIEHQSWVNRQTGLHVHLRPTLAGWNYTDLSYIVLAWVRFECVINSIIAPSRRDNFLLSRFWQLETRRESRVGELWQTRVPVGISARELLQWCAPIAPTGDRYLDRRYQLNLLSLEVHDTIEFRAHQGTTDPVKIRNWVLLLMAFCRHFKHCQHFLALPRYTQGSTYRDDDFQLLMETLVGYIPSQYAESWICYWQQRHEQFKDQSVSEPTETEEGSETPANSGMSEAIMSALGYNGQEVEMNIVHSGSNTNDHPF